MKIVGRTIAHDQHRFPTVGDWEITPNGESLIEVWASNTGNDNYDFLIMIHELIEAWLCKKRGIPEPAVRAFDIAFEKKRPEGDDSEPGDDPDAPYRKEHKFATKIERMIADELGVDWNAYDQTINAL